ncbi:hypothetical protein CDAR_413161 [Caerostris darwini]|uniref:Uncharacterized protein n=1 Tax=Caerostris darwini TaxID=1538125 RepID=A0AAV4SL64_9ARAC|nr:hypothetical protein CDAR_413161 [Caerostris darwini]
MWLEEAQNLKSQNSVTSTLPQVRKQAAAVSENPWLSPENPSSPIQYYFKKEGNRTNFSSAHIHPRFRKHPGIPELPPFAEHATEHPSLFQKGEKKEEAHARAEFV